jgi:MoxR-like ATPase
VQAAAAGRAYVIPDDVKELAVPVLAHRLVLDPEADFLGATTTQVVERVLSATPPPVARA